MKNIFLQTNSATAERNSQVNITTQVNRAKIRREKYNDREHIVLPSYTLPANVIMNGGLYPAEEIDKHYQTLEGTLAPLGHPTLDGEWISAFSPEGINSCHIGAWNRNVKKAGSRIYIEKWVDVEVAQRTERGREFLERVDALEKGEDVPPIHTSVTAMVEMLAPNEFQKKQGAEWVAKIHGFDHDAILLDEVGAATPEQGVGLMVNADQAKPLVENAGVLVSESYRQREQRLQRAAQKRLSTNVDSYVWIADFTDDQVIISVDDVAYVYGYTDDGGEIVLSDSGDLVERESSWVRAAANRIKQFFKPQARPANNDREDAEMALTAEEKAELVAEIGKAITSNLAEQFKPINESIETLKANQEAISSRLNETAAADEKAKQEAVAAKLGETVANALTGEALNEAYAKLVESADLATNHAINGEKMEIPDPLKYFGGAN